MKNIKDLLILSRAELTKVICKKLEGRLDNTKYNKILVIDEIADVTIMLEQLKIIFCISDTDIDGRVNFKVDRLKKYMNGLKKKATKAGISL